ncbi:transposase [Nonomuraea sp. NPDC052116]|uniref:transposase n=1 Tax=Nonomuraea sp. NPDC052116 TaxID=3155665 RepID=UPI00342B5FBB
MLSEFRDRRLLDTLLERAVTAGLLRAGGRQRTDSTHVLMAMRTMNRLEQVHETVRAPLNALAAAAPDWLLAQAEPGWFERYEARVEDYRLPTNTAERILLGHEIGAGGNGVLRAVYSQDAPGWLRDIPAVQTLRHVWIQQYVTIDDQLRWRTPDEQPPGTTRQISPYDGDARAGTGRDSHWNGYKVHLTETCDTDAPHLITHVITAPPPGSDYEATGNETDQGGTPVVRVRFSMRDCKACPSRDLCTRGAKGRRIARRPQEEHEALQRARQRQSTDEWQQRYAHRAGVEGTGTRPAPTRTSHFAALRPAA